MKTAIYQYLQTHSLRRRPVMRSILCKYFTVSGQIRKSRKYLRYSGQGNTAVFVRTCPKNT